MPTKRRCYRKKEFFLNIPHDIEGRLIHKHDCWFKPLFLKLHLLGLRHLDDSCESIKRRASQILKRNPIKNGDVDGVVWEG